MLKIERILTEVLNSAENNDYQGFSKFDALNSPVLDKLSFDNKWLRLLYTQLVKESPLHIRPFLNIQKSRNPKGIALFARAYLFLYQKNKNPYYLTKAEILLKWLIQNTSPGMKNLSWGYNFIWQNTIFLQEKFEPNTVVSLFAGEAFIHAYRVTGKKEYLDYAASVGRFILDDLPVLHENHDELAIAYVLRDVDAIVLNNQVLAGAFLIKLWKDLGQEDEEIKTSARKLINYTVNRKTGYNAWYYTFPYNKSLIVHDNYHTGGILDGLVEYYQETGDDRYMDTYKQGLDYYQKNLFEKNGAPRWMNNKRYPFDIHGSAQGIISFVKASDFFPEYIEQCEKIIHWTIGNLYNRKNGEFFYRKGRFWRWNYSLMRWCNAWMSRAMAEFFLKNV